MDAYLSVVRDRREVHAPTTPMWTRDMDDMLRMVLRQRVFNFDETASQIQRYILRVRTSGGMLPDEVSEPLYTRDACRMRWAELDRQLIATYAEYEAHISGGGDGGGAPPAAKSNNYLDTSVEAAEKKFFDAIQIGGKRAASATPVLGTPAPKEKAAAAAQQRQQQSSAVKPPPAAQHQFPMFKPAAPPVVARPTSTPSAAVPERRNTAESAAQKQSGRQLAELQRMAVGDAQTKQTIVQPLTSLQTRVEGLQGLLDDPGVEASVKLAEVARIQKEMASLQQLATQMHGAGGATPTVPASPMADQAKEFLKPSGGVDLESALTGLDLDGLLSSLEAGQEAGGSLDDLDD